MSPYPGAFAVVLVIAAIAIGVVLVWDGLRKRKLSRQLDARTDALIARGLRCGVRAGLINRDFK